MWKIGDHVALGVFSSPLYHRWQLYVYGIAKRVTTQTNCDIFIQIVNRINTDAKLVEGMSFTKISTIFVSLLDSYVNHAFVFFQHTFNLKSPAKDMLRHNVDWSSHII